MVPTSSEQTEAYWNLGGSAAYSNSSVPGRRPISGSAEYYRLYRARRKLQNPEKYLAHKRKDALRKRQKLRQQKQSALANQKKTD
ncbi:hypothetical protein BaRGS_00027526 [Batillaria attramentaria]|uniref:Uncharacterized protein n=1 Tax=Batillaria attramentaria TaxID=370345 RepID=A0ABD0K1T1_9CAEN